MGKGEEKVGSLIGGIVPKSKDWPRFWTVDPPSLIGSNDAVGTVTLTEVASPRGAEVEVWCSSAEVASVPPIVTVAPGSSVATFIIRTSVVNEHVSAVISAAAGITEAAAALDILPPDGNYLSALGIDPLFMVGGTSGSGTVKLATPSADKGGSVVAIWSSDPDVLSVPDTVKVRRKADAATFTVSASAVEEPVGVTVTASYGGVLQRVRVIVAPDNTPTIESLRVSPNRVPGGAMVNGIVRLTAPALDGGAAVELKRRGRNMISMPETVTVPEGNVTAFFVIETEAIHGQKERTVEIIGSHNGISASATLTIIPSQSAKLWREPITLCASLDLVPCLTRDALDITTSAVTDYERLYSFYTPKLNLLAETAASPDAGPSIAYEYIWFGGMPLAQIETGTGEIAYYFNDHLGTPILQTNGAGNVVWQPEYEPYGSIVGTYTGEGRHQPLRFPGQESDGLSDLSQNIFRWYRAGWGRYTQADPLGVEVGPVSEGLMHLYGYVSGRPTRLYDDLGLFEIDDSCNPCISRPAGPGAPSANQYTTLYREIEMACKKQLSEITNVPLRRCVGKSCDRGKVICRDNCPSGQVGGTTDVVGAAIMKMFGSAIRSTKLCVNNWERLRKAGIGNVAIHEWAHGCGWLHRRGGGVPGDSGKF